MGQFSDANPIHIFYEDEETFNGTHVDNIDHECYNHEHQCDEPVLEQYFEDENDDEYDFVFYDENDVEIHRIEMVQSELLSEIETEDLEDFDNLGAGDVDWDLGETPSITIPDGPLLDVATSKKLAPPSELAFLPGKIYRFNFNATKNGPLVFTVKVLILDEDGGILETQNIIFASAAGSYDKSVDIVMPEGAVSYAFYTEKTGTGGGGISLDLTINSYSIERIAYLHTAEFTASDLDFCERRIRFEVVRRSDDEIFGHTDYIYFPEECKSSVLILYKANKNFAGLIYDEYSEYRYLRVKGRFFHPGKSGSAAFSEQSNGTVITRNWTMKKKKLLEVQDCPEYMNTKIDLALAHCVDGDVTINEVSWELADGDLYEYEGAADRPDTYSLQAGKAWLSRKNYFKQNTI